MEYQRLLNHLFGDFVNYYAELTYIDPEKHYGLQPHIFTESYQIGTDRVSWEHVDHHNRRGYSVYYAVTPKHTPTPRFKRSKELDAAFCQALWVDIDLKDKQYDSIEHAYNALAAYKPVPNVIIETGGGLHGIWRIEPIPVTKDTLPVIKSHLRGLALSLKGDTSVAELARVLRLPGTINTKPERGGVLCKLAEGIIYDKVYHVDYFPRANEETRPKPQKRDVPPSTMPGYIRWFLTGNHTNERNNSLNWTAHKMYLDGFTVADAEALLLNHAVEIGLHERAALATIRSPFKAGGK